MKIFYRRAPTRHDFRHLMIRSFEACVLAAERAGRKSIPQIAS
jgi:hypothetical protein